MRLNSTCQKVYTEVRLIETGRPYKMRTAALRRRSRTAYCQTLIFLMFTRLAEIRFPAENRGHETLCKFYMTIAGNFYTRPSKNSVSPTFYYSRRCYRATFRVLKVTKEVRRARSKPFNANNANFILTQPVDFADFQRTYRVCGP